MNQWLKMGLDLGPLLLFFVCYRFFGIWWAIPVLILVTLASVAVTYALTRKWAIIPVISAVILSVFGGLALYLHDETFIKIKPTIVNLLFAAILLGGVWRDKPVLKLLLGEAMPMQEKGWRILSLRWGVFFIFLAVLNEIIWRHFSTDFWVNFKVFGMFTLTLIFTAAQVPLMKRYMVEEESRIQNSEFSEEEKSETH